MQLNPNSTSNTASNTLERPILWIWWSIYVWGPRKLKDIYSHSQCLNFSDEDAIN